LKRQQTGNVMDKEDISTDLEISRGLYRNYKKEIKEVQ
jgi:hypothetical protein